MRLNNIQYDDYFKLFVKREGRVVLGKNYSTLWLLTAVLSTTFLAIAFSNASMHYLSEKMNDPFIRWMDISNRDEGRFKELEYSLGEPENMARFDYESYQADNYRAYMFFGAPGCDVRYLRVRFFEDMHTELMDAILAEENVIESVRVEEIPEETAGLFITEDAMKLLGYKDIPSYIELQGLSEGADTLGVKLTSDNFARVPLPVLGVVRRLPSGVDMVASQFLFEQDNNDNTYPFNMNKLVYARSLSYFVPESVLMEDFCAALKETGQHGSSVPVYVDEISFWKPEIEPYLKGDFVTLRGKSAQMIPLEAAAINEQLLERWAGEGVRRVYDYTFSPYETAEKLYLSVYFNSLDNIRDFESWVNDEFKVKVDMSQVNAKENFNAVSIMAGILSWAIIVFAIVCIVLFIVNLLQSYFQKVKRNLGTFKAFGVSNSQLISVYALIVEAIIFASIVIAFLFTFFTQELLIVAGFLKDGTYSYLSLWGGKTIASIVIIITVSALTVYFVMRNLLRQTPGDLIYDRQ